MDKLFPVLRLWLIAFALTGASVVQASGGGPGDEEAGDDNISVYLALGAAAIIGAILIFDIFSGPEGGDPAMEAVTETEKVTGSDSTGVDWDSVIAGIEPPLVVVSVFPASSGGGEAASLFLELLAAAHGHTFAVYPDPISLGLDSPSEESALAGEFFGADFFVTARETDTGLLLQLYRGMDGPVWSYQTTATDARTLELAADDLAAMVEETGSN